MPIRYRTMKDLKEKTKNVLGEVRRLGAVVITNRGKPEAILQPFSDDELLAIQLLRSKPVRLALERAMREARAGRTVPAEAVIAKVVAAHV
jgi:prevent-host-death family protein